MTTKTKIVLDADVIIHFVKVGQFSLLLDIFPEYQYLILDVVYDEVTVNGLTKTQIDNTLQFFASRIVRACLIINVNDRAVSRRADFRL